MFPKFTYVLWGIFHDAHVVRLMARIGIVEIDEEDVSSIVLDIYFKDAVDYEESAYGALLIYDNTAAWFDYKLTASDKKALKNFN